jgi:hypothetical protein
MRVVFLVFGACMCALDTMENMALSHLAIRLIKLCLIKIRRYVMPV